MTQVKWSKREKDYLMSLAQDGEMSVEEAGQQPMNKCLLDNGQQAQSNKSKLLKN